MGQQDLNGSKPNLAQWNLLLKRHKWDLNIFKYI